MEQRVLENFELPFYNIVLAGPIVTSSSFVIIVTSSSLVGAKR
jgi:hypothetical protein